VFDESGLTGAGEAAYGESTFVLGGVDNPVDDIVPSGFLLWGEF
jgi:hypothetical protein